jgi:hypothetical protein
MRARWALRLAVSVPLFLACGRGIVEKTDGTSDTLLPNNNVFEVGHDGAPYLAIAEWFKTNGGHDLHVDTTNFDPAWPIVDTKPAVLNRLGTPVLFGQFGYYHTGFDVIRSEQTVGMDALAPHDGIAVVFDWDGNKISAVENPQMTVLAIYDNDTVDPAGSPIAGSHVVTQMMHIRPLDAIVQSTEPFAVKKGQIIGSLVPAPIAASDAATKLAHTHLNFIDGENGLMLNPAKLFRVYPDTKAPTIKGAKVAGEDAKVKSEFVSGKTDVIVEAFDRDENSGRNLEVAAIEFSIKDQDGNVLASQPRCELNHLIESLHDLGDFRARELIDFGSASLSGGWPSSDIDNKNRTFRYALTQLAVTPEGRCTVKNDADGFIELTDQMTKLLVSVTMWDVKGNKGTPLASDPDGGAGVETPIEIKRLPGSIEAGAPDGGSDASAPRDSGAR